MKKLLYILISTSFFIGANVNAEVERVSNDSSFGKRITLIETIGKNNIINFGFNISPENGYEFRDVVNKLMPLSNYITEKTNKLTIIDPVSKDNEIALDAITYNYDIVFTTALSATELARFSWTPLLKTDNDVELVILSSNNNDINKKNLLNKKIIVNKVNNDKYHIKYGLLKDKLITTDNFKLVEVAFDINDQLKNLDTNKIDGIVISKDKANKIINQNNKYKIVYSSEKITNHILMINPALSNASKDFYKNMFLEMNKLNILNNALSEKNNINFIEPEKDVLNYSRDLILKLKLSIKKD